MADVSQGNGSGDELNHTYDEIAAEESTGAKLNRRSSGSIGRKGTRKVVRRVSSHDVPSMFTPTNVGSRGTPGQKHIERYSDRVGYTTTATTPLSKVPMNKKSGSLQKMNDGSRGATPNAGSSSLKFTGSRQEVGASPFGPAQKPAPNSYTPKHGLTKPKRAEWSFGSDERMRHMGYTGHESTGPGPGAYFPTTTFMSRVRRGPGAAFPTETRRISENWSKGGKKKTKKELRDQAVRMMTAGPREFEKSLEKLKKRRDKEDRRVLESRSKSPGPSSPGHDRMNMSSSFSYVGPNSRVTDSSTYTYQPRPKSNTPYSEYYQDPDSPLRTGESFRDRLNTTEIKKEFYRQSQGNPPPDAYIPRHVVTKPAVKQISMGSEDRFKHLGFRGHESTGPGPGQYFPTHSYASNYRRAPTHAMPTQSRPISEDWNKKKKKKGRPQSADPTISNLEDYREKVLNNSGVDTTGELDAEVAGITRPQSAGAARTSKQRSTVSGGDWLEPYRETGERRRETQLDDYHKQYVSSSDVAKSPSFSYLSNPSEMAKPTEGAQTVLASKIEQPPPTAYDPKLDYVKDKTLNTVFPKDDRHKYLGSSPHPGPGPGAYDPLDRFSSRRTRLGAAQFLTETRPISEDWQRPGGLRKGKKAGLNSSRSSNRPSSAPPKRATTPGPDDEPDTANMDLVEMKGSVTIENGPPVEVEVAFMFDDENKVLAEVLMDGEPPVDVYYDFEQAPPVLKLTTASHELEGTWYRGTWKGFVAKDGSEVGQFALFEDQ